MGAMDILVNKIKSCQSGAISRGICFNPILLAATLCSTVPPSGLSSSLQPALTTSTLDPNSSFPYVLPSRGNFSLSHHPK